MSYDFTGAMPADQTKIAFFNDLTQPGDGTDAWTIYIDNLAQTTGGDTGGGDTGGTDTGPKDVTFSVDMTGVDLTDGNPTLQSTFNNWCGACNPMSDDDGDNIWTVTVNIPQGDHEYKYALGAWVSQESVPADCDNTLGANRAVTVTGDVTLATDVYSGCPGDDTSGGDTGGTDPEPPVSATIALPVDFEEAADAYEIAGFDGGVATVEAGPDGAVSLKYVKGAGQNWAGVWINLDTAVDAANGEIVTAAVHSTVARDITLKFDAANVERVASHTGSGWEALSYDFTGAMPADQTKIAFFNDLTQPGDGTDAWTIYIDNLAQTTGGDTGGGDTGGTDTGPKDVTFSVDMTGVDLTDGNPTLQSTFNNWCGACNPMSDDDGDNIWTVTVNIPQGDHEYKYALGAWVSQESVPADCDNTLGANRAVTVTGDVTLATDVYSGCPGDDTSGGDTGGTDPEPPVSATIALPVDFEEAADAYEIAGFDGGVATVEAGPDGAVSLKYVKGAGQNWAGVWINLDTAVDAANGEIVTAAVHSTVARDITLKFDAANVERVASHTGSGWEALSYDFTGAMPADQTKIAFFNDLTQPGDGTDAWTIYIDNLAQTTGGDTGGGDTGGTDTGPKDVTFSVDMTGVDLTDGNPTLQSTFNNWCGACNPMSDDDGDNIWTVTVNIPQGDHEYKYALGAWVSQESVPADCDNTLGANRAVTVTGDVTLATDVYSGCPGDDTSGGDTGGTDPELTPADGFVISEAFGGTTIGEGSVYTYPAGTEAWAGFANTNTSLYPMTIAEDSVITFTGSVPAGGDADVRFRFELNPHPDAEPSFNTAAVTVSGADAATYTVAVPAQGANTFSSFLLYLNTQDVGVVVTDIAISAAPAGPVDSDNDGVNDDEDAFPNDASETADSDNDGTGDNADAFPNDASETADSDNDGVGDNADYAPNDPAVQSGPAQVVTVAGNPAAVVGQTMSVEISYDVTDGDSTLTGLGLNVHYNSALITFEAFSNVLATDNISSAGPFSDSDDSDADTSTDMYVSVAWASLFGNWPNVLPASLATIDFMVEEAAADEDSVRIGFSSTSNAAGYAFQGDSTEISVVGSNWDFDGNGSADALTDGLLLVRYAFGLRGDKLVGDGVVADDSTLTAQEIEAKITEAQDIADIDGNGTVDPLSDGLLLLRHLFGFSGESLVKGVVHPDGSRQSAEEITSYMNGFMPQ